MFAQERKKQVRNEKFKCDRVLFNIPSTISPLFVGAGDFRGYKDSPPSSPKMEPNPTFELILSCFCYYLQPNHKARLALPSISPDSDSFRLTLVATTVPIAQTQLH